MNNTGRPTFRFPWFLRLCQEKVLDKPIPWNVKRILSIWLHLIECGGGRGFLLVIWIELGQTWPSTPPPRKNSWEETARFEPCNRWYWCTWRKVTGCQIMYWVSLVIAACSTFWYTSPREILCLSSKYFSNIHCSNSWHYGCFRISHRISNFEEVWLSLEPNTYLPVGAYLVVFLRGLTHLGEWLVLFICVASDQFQSCRNPG